jgi:RecA/RadA recombinase
MSNNSLYDVLTATICTLQANGIRSPEDIICMNNVAVSERTGLSIEALDLIVCHTMQRYAGSITFCTAGTIADQSAANELYRTGMPGIDKMLLGGLCLGEVTEILGPTAVGKSQFCLMLTGYIASTTNANVIYIDTSNSFSVSRLSQMHFSWIQRATSYVKPIEAALNSIKVVSSFSLLSCWDVLSNIRSKLESCREEDDFYSNLRILVIDSIHDILSPILGPASIGHSMMAQFARALKALARTFNIAIVVTNRVTTTGLTGTHISGTIFSSGSYGNQEHSATTGALLDKSALKPALGSVWLSVPDTRILFQTEHQSTSSSKQHSSDQSTDEQRNRFCSVLIKSCKCKLGDTATFVISDIGLQDAND